jgi:hypothetical protein
MVVIAWIALQLRYSIALDPGSRRTRVKCLLPVNIRRHNNCNKYFLFMQNNSHIVNCIRE